MNVQASIESDRARVHSARSDSTQLNSVADILKIFTTWRLTSDWLEFSWVGS